MRSRPPFIALLALFVLSSCAHVSGSGRLGGTQTKTKRRSHTLIYIDGKPKADVESSSESESSSASGGIMGSGW